jgi:hypothetical protein
MLLKFHPCVTPGLNPLEPIGSAIRVHPESLGSEAIVGPIAGGHGSSLPGHLRANYDGRTREKLRASGLTITCRKDRRPSHQDGAQWDHDENSHQNRRQSQSSKRASGAIGHGHVHKKVTWLAAEVQHVVDRSSP